MNELGHGLSELAEGLDLSEDELGVISGASDRTSLWFGSEDLLANACAARILRNPAYAALGGRLLAARLRRKLGGRSFVETTRVLRDAGSVSEEHAAVVEELGSALDEAVDYRLDYGYSYFAFRTLEKSYLLRGADGEVAERPQDMLMRVAVAIHGGNLEAVLRTYRLTAAKKFTHASPVLFNAGTPNPQLSSCFLLNDCADVYENLRRCGVVSSACGGVGVAAHEASRDFLGLMRLYDDLSKYADGKRPGAFAIYLEPWHESIFDFLAMRKNTGVAMVDLFTALWIPDLFMERVRQDGDWSLMNPAESPGLADVFGLDFERLYLDYESRGARTAVVKARKVWEAAIESQIETGTPYMLYKDACNRKSNHIHLGTIRCSNLCAEIVEYSSPDEVATCNLASIALDRFVDEERLSFDFEALADVTRTVVENLNEVIDRAAYPVPHTTARDRPIGVGVQGLADAFAAMRLPFDSAGDLNAKIFETLYHAALDSSCSLAERHGPHESFEGSPAAGGLLQFDLWGVEPSFRDWAGLKARVAKFGLRNSLVVALMPTASTAQIMDESEGIDPYIHNVYQRTVTAGTFQVVNERMYRDLSAAGLWTEAVVNQIVADRGSIQRVAGVPDSVKKLYQTAWEISQKTLIDLSAGRAPFVDQSQSLNLYLASPKYANVSSMHFYAFDRGLKTGMYYLRTMSSVRPLSFVLKRMEGESCESCSG